MKNDPYIMAKTIKGIIVGDYIKYAESTCDCLWGRLSL